MGSFVEQNDTLQISKDQGFPGELVLEQHLINPFHEKDFRGKVYHFSNKPAIRNYPSHPVRTFLAENREDTWIYWGTADVLSTTHDYEKKTTAGSFRIRQIFTPLQMKAAFRLTDGRREIDFWRANTFGLWKGVHSVRMLLLGKLNETNKQIFHRVIQVANDLSIEVRSPLDVSEEKRYTNAMLSVMTSDIVVCIDEAPSTGMGMEVGWAKVIGTPVYTYSSSTPSSVLLQEGAINLAKDFGDHPEKYLPTLVEPFLHI